MEYSKAKEGKATTIKINEGITVQIISIAVPWTTLLPLTGELRASFSKEKYCNVRPIIIRTKKKIKVMKNIKSWCKLMIPSMTGLALS
jgi:hypothetical protein